MTRAVNKSTGEVVEWTGSEWIPVAGPATVAPPSAEYQPDRPTGLESFGRGMLDIWQGGGQLARMAGEGLGLLPEGSEAAYTASVAPDIRRYEAGAGPGIDWGRLVGQFAPTAPLGVGTSGGLGVRLVSGAAQGASASQLPVAMPEESRAARAVSGGALGALGAAAAPMVAGVLGKVRRKVLGSAPKAAALEGALTEAGIDPASLPPDLLDRLAKDAAEQLRRTGKVDSASLARRADMEAEGLQPTAAQVSRDPAQWARERNLSKLDFDEAGNPLAARFEEQNLRLKERASALAQESGKAEEAVAAGERARRVAEMRSRLSQRRVGRAYSEARDEIGADSTIPSDGLAARWAPISDDFENAMPPDVKRRVQQLIDPESKRAFTPREAEKLIQLVNKHWDPKDPARTAALNSVRQATIDSLDEIGEAAGGEAADAFKVAREKAAERFRALRPKGVQRLLDPDYPAERFIQTDVIAGGLKDVRETLRFFGGGSPREQAIGQQVLGGLRRQVDEWLYRQATSKAGETFSGTNYSAALDRFGKEKLTALFGADGAARRLRLGRASRAATTQPFGAAVNVSNTAPSLVSYLSRVSGGAFKNIPLVGPAVSGMAEAAKKQAARAEAAAALSGMNALPEADLTRQALSRPLSWLPVLGGLLGGQSQ